MISYNHSAGPTAQGGPANGYRIALLVDDTRVSKWVRDLADWADAHPHIELVALIIHAREKQTKSLGSKFMERVRRKGLQDTISRAAFSLATAAEQKLVLRSPRFHDHLRLHSIADRVGMHVRIKPEVSQSGFVHRFSDAEVQKVRDLDLDALVRCGSGILKGSILQAARDGVVSLHHGDNRVNRGSPPAFWEVLQREPQTGFIVQRLNEELDGGDVLFRGSIQTELFFTRNLAKLRDAATLCLGQTLERLACGEVAPEPAHIYDRTLYRSPRLHDTLSYLLRTAWRAARKLIADAVGVESHWGVAYTFQDWEKAVLWRGKTLPCPKGSFIADPFAITVDGKHYVFVEEFIYSVRKGVISAYRVERGGAERLGIVLEEPHHLSFPFIFQHEGEIYMVPESAADRNIKLYRCTRFPGEWSLTKVLMSGVDALDTILFRDGGRWWMMTTIRRPGAAANFPELHAFWSDSPLGEWTPHSLNPLFSDDRARNGGLLRDNGYVYRVAQRTGFRRYGAGFWIYRILELTPDRYEEVLVQEVRPNFLPGLSGTHHIHSDTGVTVYDFCREIRPC